MTSENFYVVYHLIFALVFVTAQPLDDLNRQGQANCRFDWELFLCLDFPATYPIAFET